MGPFNVDQYFWLIFTKHNYFCLWLVHFHSFVFQTSDVCVKAVFGPLHQIFQIRIMYNNIWVICIWGVHHVAWERFTNYSRIQIKEDLAQCWSMRAASIYWFDIRCFYINLNSPNISRISLGIFPLIRSMNKSGLSMSNTAERSNELAKTKTNYSQITSWSFWLATPSKSHIQVTGMDSSLLHCFIFNFSQIPYRMEYNCWIMIIDRCVYLVDQERTISESDPDIENTLRKSKEIKLKRRHFLFENEYKIHQPDQWPLTYNKN